MTLPPETLAKLKALNEGRTRGPWKLVIEKRPYQVKNFDGSAILTGEHEETRIFTDWDHPQLKGPLGVVNSSVGAPPKEGAPWVTMVRIEKHDADFIAALANNATALLSIAERAQFLLDRLREFEDRAHFTHDGYREWCHVAPAIERLSQALTAPGASSQGDGKPEATGTPQAATQRGSNG